MVSIGEALKYPFSKFSRLFNVYWMLIPLLGAFAVCGYVLNIMREVIKGNKKELPAFGSFGDNMGDGFKLFGLVLVLGLALMGIFLLLGILPVVGPILALAFYAVGALTVPIMVLQYAESRKFSDGIDFKKALLILKNNLGSYLLMYLKMAVVGVVFFIPCMFVLPAPIFMPALMFSSPLFMGDFYANAGKGSSAKPAAKAEKEAKKAAKPAKKRK